MCQTKCFHIKGAMLASQCKSQLALNLNESNLHLKETSLPPRNHNILVASIRPIKCLHFTLRLSTRIKWYLAKNSKKGRHVFPLVFANRANPRCRRLKAIFFCQTQTITRFVSKASTRVQFIRFLTALGEKLGRKGKHHSQQETRVLFELPRQDLEQRQRHHRK